MLITIRRKEETRRHASIRSGCPRGPAKPAPIAPTLAKGWEGRTVLIQEQEIVQEVMGVRKQFNHEGSIKLPHIGNTLGQYIVQIYFCDPLLKTKSENPKKPLTAM